MNYNETIDKIYKALDLIPDLEDYLKRGHTLTEIMDSIYEDLEDIRYRNKEFNAYVKLYPNIFINGDIFTGLMEWDFLAYCEKRFPTIKWQHETVETYWVTASGGDAKCS